MDIWNSRKRRKNWISENHVLIHFFEVFTKFSSLDQESFNWFMMAVLIKIIMQKFINIYLEIKPGAHFENWCCLTYGEVYISSWSGSHLQCQSIKMKYNLQRGKDLIAWDFIIRFMSNYHPINTLSVLILICYCTS